MPHRELPAACRPCSLPPVARHRLVRSRHRCGVRLRAWVDSSPPFHARHDAGELFRLCPACVTYRFPVDADRDGALASEGWCCCERVFHARAAWAQGDLELAKARLSPFKSSLWMCRKEWYPYIGHQHVCVFDAEGKAVLDRVWVDPCALQPFEEPVMDAGVGELEGQWLPVDPDGNGHVCGCCLGSSFVEEFPGSDDWFTERLETGTPGPEVWRGGSRHSPGWIRKNRWEGSDIGHEVVEGSCGERKICYRSKELCSEGKSYPEILGPQRHWLANGWHPPLECVPGRASDLGHWQVPSEAPECVCAVANTLFAVMSDAVGHGLGNGSGVDDGDGTAMPDHGGLVAQADAPQSHCLTTRSAQQIDHAWTIEKPLPQARWVDEAGRGSAELVLRGIMEQARPAPDVSYNALFVRVRVPLLTSVVVG